VSATFAGKYEKDYCHPIRATEHVCGWVYVMSGNSPTVRVTCVTCGFGYDSDFELWSRTSPSKTSFRHLFSSMLESFPVPPTNRVVGEVVYRQSFKTNTVWMESVNYTSRERQTIVFARTTNWMAASDAIQTNPLRNACRRRTDCTWILTTTGNMC